VSRTLESRIGKLEQKSGIHDADQLFLMWCRPEQDEDEILLDAAKKGMVDLDAGKGTWPGGRAICCHWTGDDPMPEPRWTTIKAMTEDELTYLLASAKARLLRNGQITQEQWDEIAPGPSLKDSKDFERERNERRSRFFRPRSLQ
jgi:hypothetical protein